MFRHSDVPLFVSAQPVSMGLSPGVLSRSYTGSWRPHTPRASLRTASPPHAPFEPRRDPTILLWHRPKTFPLESNSAAAHNQFTFIPPTAPIHYLVRGHVERPDLCSTCYVHRGRCVACITNLLPKTLADLRSPDSHDVWSVPPFWQYVGLFVKKLTRSPSRLSLASPSAWKTSRLHSKRIMHPRELQCIATEVVQEPGSTPHLLVVLD